MYTRRFSSNHKISYSLSHKAAYLGLAGTFIIFFSFLYNLFIDGEMLFFYSNLAVFILLMIFLVSLIVITKKEMVISITKSNYILFLGFCIFVYTLMYGVNMYMAFQPVLISMDFLSIVLTVFLNLLCSALLIIDGCKSYQSIAGRYTRIYKRIVLKRNLVCFFGIVFGIGIGLLIAIT